jgi:PKD repeat protein
MRADNFDQMDGRLVSKATGTGEQDHYWMVSTIDQTGLRFRLKTGGQTTTLKSSPGVVQAGTWHHVAAVYDGSQMRLYRDGEQVASKGKSGSLSTSGSVPAALGDQPQGGRSFDGLLDEVRLYGRALSADEVLALYEEQPGDSPPNEAPVAQASASPTTGEAPLEVSFDGSGSSDTDGTIVSYAWDFGDGATGTGAVVSHTYGAAGSYAATLTVTDDDGATATTDPITITVEAANVPPTVSLVAPDDGATFTEGDPIPIAATVDDPDGSVQRVRFFANGTLLQEDTSAPFEMNWVNATPGTHDLKARARDNDGAWSTSVVHTITVEEAERVTEGLQVLYDFEEGQGTTIQDVSGVGEPLNLKIDDTEAVRWTPDGLSIDEATLITSTEEALKVTEAVTTTDEVTLEAWIKTASLDQDGPARIVTLSGDSQNRNLMLGQGRWGNKPTDTYDIRLRTTETDDNGRPSTTTEAGVVKEDLQHVVFVREAGGDVRVYVDSVLVKTATVGGTLQNWNETYELALGNEFVGNRPWLGEYHLVAIYGRALTPEEVQQNFEVGANPSAPVTASMESADAMSTPVSLRGDLQGDGAVTAEDAALLLRQVVQGTSSEEADVSGDGTVTAHDAWLIQQAAHDEMPCLSTEAGCSAAAATLGSATLAWGPPRFAGGQVQVPLLLADVRGPVTSLQLAVPLDPDVLSLAEVRTTAEGWHIEHAVSDGRLRLAMMSETLASEGPVLTLTLELLDARRGAVLGGTGFVHEQAAQTLASVAASVPEAVQLFDNYPNPFNPSTQIRYQLPASTPVRLDVFNTLGQQVITLVDTEQGAGTYTVAWDGRSGAGRQVTSGTYLYRLQAGDRVITKKMLLVK